jgi:hypothetical protein
VGLRLAITAAVLLLVAGSGAIAATILTAHSPTGSGDLLGHMSCALAQQAATNPNGPSNGAVTDIYQAAPMSTNPDIRRAGQTFRTEVDHISADEAGLESHLDLVARAQAVQTFWNVCINVGYISG